MKSKLFFLDLLFGDETQTQEGEKTKYLARIKGNRSQRFNLIPIQKLPTLEEIVSPQSQPSSSNSFPQDGG